MKNSVIHVVCEDLHMHNLRVTPLISGWLSELAIYGLMKMIIFWILSCYFRLYSLSIYQFSKCEDPIVLRLSRRQVSLSWCTSVSPVQLVST